MKRANIVTLVAAISLLGVFAFPLWKIQLRAPQYPDGVNMYIWINKISGDTPSTLQNINILNHYIGMKYIHPESIPELKYFSYVVFGLVLTGIVFAFMNNKLLVLIWSILLVILASLAIYDFYLWEYDYGHNLDPKAPIKIPGMEYQPPLIGSKTILNFKAISFPYFGSAFIFLSIATGFLSYILYRYHDKEKGK